MLFFSGIVGLWLWSSWGLNLSELFHFLLYLMYKGAKIFPWKTVNNLFYLLQTTGKSIWFTLIKFINISTLSILFYKENNAEGRINKWSRSKFYLYDGGGGCWKVHIAMKKHLKKNQLFGHLVRFWKTEHTENFTAATHNNPF